MVCAYNLLRTYNKTELYPGEILSYAMFMQSLLLIFTVMYMIGLTYIYFRISNEEKPAKKHMNHLAQTIWNLVLVSSILNFMPCRLYETYFDQHIFDQWILPAVWIFEISLDYSIQVMIILGTNTCVKRVSSKTHELQSIEMNKSMHEKTGYLSELIISVFISLVFQLCNAVMKMYDYGMYVSTIHWTIFAISLFYIIIKVTTMKSYATSEKDDDIFSDVELNNTHPFLGIYVCLALVSTIWSGMAMTSPPMNSRVLDEFELKYGSIATFAMFPLAILSIVLTTRDKKMLAREEGETDSVSSNI